jgi:hypothetical protein
MIILDYILRLIWAIITLGIVGLIIYFRKSLISILHALSDIETLKVGPLEFKRRQLEEVAKAMESDSSISKSRSEHSPVSPISKDERIKQLENKIDILNKQLAGTATVAVSTATQYIPAERVSFLEQIRDQALKDVTTSDADSPIVKSALPLTRECSTCARFKLRNKDDYYGICEKDQDVRQSYWCCEDWVSRSKS